MVENGSISFLGQQAQTQGQLVFLGKNDATRKYKSQFGEAGTFWE
jgi:hypothetical protein